MKCPLSTYMMFKGTYGETGVTGDCLKEECAWWDKTRESCAVLTTATFLVLIKDYVRGICEDLSPKK